MVHQTTYGGSRQVQLDVHAEFVSDVLRGHDRTEMRITFNRFIEEEAPAGDD